MPLHNPEAKVYGQHAHCILDRCILSSPKTLINKSDATLRDPVYAK